MSKNEKLTAKQIRIMAKNNPAELVAYITDNKLPWGKTLSDANVAQINCFKLIIERYLGESKSYAEVTSAIKNMAPHCKLGTLQSYLPWFVRSPKSVGRPCPHNFILLEFAPKTYTAGRRNSITESIGDAIISQARGQGKGPKKYENLSAILHATKSDVHTGKVKPIIDKKWLAEQAKADKADDDKAKK